MVVSKGLENFEEVFGGTKLHPVSQSYRSNALGSSVSLNRDKAPWGCYSHVRSACKF